MRQRGFTLVELMISMVLGLVVIGGAMGVIFSNRQSYRTNEGLSQVQESARTAFELLSRDVRQAGVTGCDNTGRIANVVVSESGTSPPWWQNWFGLRGFDNTQADGAVGFGTAMSTRISGTDSLQLQGIEGTGLSVVNHVPNSVRFEISAATAAIAANDILMVCDFDHAAILKVTSYNSTDKTVFHGANLGGYPRNCSPGLGYPTDCVSTGGNSYTYGPNAQIARFAAVNWYIGNNGRPDEGGRSLFRRRLSANPEEIVAGVTDMQITYREAGGVNFVSADTVGTWANVNALMVTLTLNSADQRVSTNTGANAGRLERVFTNVITLRNRVP